MFFIHYSLLEDFPTSEEVWNLVARRPIDEANSEVKKGTAVITGLWFFFLYNIDSHNRHCNHQYLASYM